MDTNAQIYINNSGYMDINSSKQRNTYLNYARNCIYTNM